MIRLLIKKFGDAEVNSANNKVGLDGDSLSSNHFYYYNTCARTYIPD